MKIIPILEAALQDPAFVVRESAIDELAELKAVSSIEKIERLINDNHSHVRQAAATAIEELRELDSNI